MAQALQEVRVFKILRPDAWSAAERTGTVAREGIDARDGFVHLSAAAQVAGTLARYFSDAESVALVAFDAGAFGEALRWEASRDGALFPHLYGALRADAARAIWRLSRGADGAFVLPAEVA